MKVHGRRWNGWGRLCDVPLDVQWLPVHFGGSVPTALFLVGRVLSLGRLAFVLLTLLRNLQCWRLE